MENTVAGRDAFLSQAATSVGTERVPCPELGAGFVAIVRGMTGTERDAYQESLIIQKGNRRRIDMKDITARLVARCLVGEDGARLFSDDEIGRVGALRGDVLNRLATVAQRLSGISDEDLEELGKTSGTRSGDSSSSASPSSSGNR